MVYKKGDRVIYGIHGVCNILDIEIRKVDRNKIEYYVLEPVEQLGSRYFVPTQNQVAVSKLRPILTRQELDVLLTSEQTNQDTWISDENQRKQRYRELINSSDRSALIAMVRTLHRQRSSQIAAGKKFHLCDDNFLKDAEKLLGTEFALVLGISPSEVGEYICNTMGISK